MHLIKNHFCIGSTTKPWINLRIHTCMCAYASCSHAYLRYILHFTPWLIRIFNFKWTWIIKLHIILLTVRNLEKLYGFLSVVIVLINLCCWHVIRKAIWRNLEVRNLEILRNICLFSSSCLCPLGCLSFVRWKKIKIKYYVIFRDF